MLQHRHMHYFRRSRPGELVKRVLHGNTGTGEMGRRRTGTYLDGNQNERKRKVLARGKKV